MSPLSESRGDASRNVVRAALGKGFRFVALNPGLVALLWSLNLGLAALLAVPLASTLGADLEGSAAASRMLHGFDWSWWAAWRERQSGYEGTLGPAILGVGLAFDNLSRLLRGALPLGLFSEAERGEAPLLALGAVYMLVQLYLWGGVLATVRRGGRGSLRGLLHGGGFYFPRLLRVALLSLAGAALVFALHAPLESWAVERARAAVSESAASSWLIGHHLALLVALASVFTASGYAKVISVVEDRASASLAWLGAIGLCVRHPLRTAGHSVVLAALGALLLAAWAHADGAWEAAGYRTQVVALALGQLLVIGRLALRLAWIAGQVVVYRACVR
jgi:voltage-gated potassium channel Kch